MRSAAFTLLLLGAATLLGGTAGWCLLKGDLSALLGAPPTVPGQRLYPDLQAGQVTGIRITTAAGGAVFAKTPNGWIATQPWTDRMDPLAATAIVAFTLGLRVEESADLAAVPLKETGLTDEQAVYIRLEDANGRPLAKYRLGKLSPWLARGPDDSTRVPTVYVQPVDKNRKRHVFIATGDILPLFRNNLVHLRDHHPFYFHPAMLREVRIRNPKGELTLARANPTADSPWRITKPLELRTEPTAVLALLDGLLKLTAVSLTDQPAAPPPSPSPAGGEMEISLGFFNTANGSVLKVRPPASATATEAVATVSDRPGIDFLLPLSPRRDAVTLADIPLSVNELRDPALARLDRRRLHTVIIQPATGEDIHLIREEANRWTTRVDGATCRANEIRLFELLTAMESQRALGFESDAATDFKPWGLDRPVLRLTFVDLGGVSLTLRFGLDKRGRLFANRQGSPTVMRLDPLLLSKVAVNAYEWRQAQLWSVNRVDLIRIERQAPDRPNVALNYDFFFDTWQAASGDRDVTDRLNPLRANYLLGGVENISVERWLAPQEPTATAALAKPTLTLTITAKTVDARGNEAGTIRRKLELAPLGGTLPAAAYYGRLEGERYLFQVDPETYEKLAVDPVDKES